MNKCAPPWINEPVTFSFMFKSNYLSSVKLFWLTLLKITCFSKNFLDIFPDWSHGLQSAYKSYRLTCCKVFIRTGVSKNFQNVRRTKEHCEGRHQDVEKPEHNGDITNNRTPQNLQKIKTYQGGCQETYTNALNVLQEHLTSNYYSLHVTTISCILYMYWICCRMASRSLFSCKPN